MARGICIRWQHLIFVLFYAQWFSCIKKIGECCVCWAVRPVLHSSSSNCLVLIPHTQLGNLSKYYKFERADTLCEHFNKFINTLIKEREQEESKENYPWLDPSDEGKYMTDKEILEKYIDLDKSCLREKEKKEVRDMLYMY